MKTFKHNGKMGDIIYSLPTIKALGGGILYIPEYTAESPCLYSCMKTLLDQQPCIHEVRLYPSGLGYNQKAIGIHIDYDLDLHRTHPLRGYTHVVKRFLEVFDLNVPNWKDPWLVVEGPRIENIPYYLFNVTRRFRDNSRVNWRNTLAKARKYKIPCYFLGTDEEHEAFVSEAGDIDRVFVDNALDVALLVRDARLIYCNQSFVLTLAQGLGKNYACEFKPNKMNCRIGTANESMLL